MPDAPPTPTKTTDGGATSRKLKFKFPAYDTLVVGENRTTASQDPPTASNEPQVVDFKENPFPEVLFKVGSPIKLSGMRPVLFTTITAVAV
jgi:hypothetical protein